LEMDSEMRAESERSGIKTVNRTLCFFWRVEERDRSHN
jgi:hypothetical protein